MRNGPILACASLFTALAAMPSNAEEIERYRLERTAEGYVRLDTQTGRMSMCQERDGQLVCRVAADELAAYDRDVEALQARIEALEDRVAALEGSRTQSAVPSEKEFEETLSYMERFLRRFMGIVTDLERNFGKGDPDPQSDRT